MVLSELHLALIGAGATAIAAIWGYNAWQDRQHRKAAEKLFKGNPADVLLSGAGAGEVSGERETPPTAISPVVERASDERLEPRIGGFDAPAMALDEATAAPAMGTPMGDSTPPPDAVSPVAAEFSEPASVTENPLPGSAEAAPVVARAVSEDIAPVDLLADCVVRFTMPSAVQAGGIWAAQRAWSATLSKTPVWLGRNRDSGEWTRLTESVTDSYSEWIAALPLADRRGPVSEAEVTAFIDGLRKLGEHLGTPIDLPDAGETVLRANALDQFCAAVDVQFSLQVVDAGGGVFVGTKLRGVCEAAGLAWATDGCFHAIDDKGEELFKLANIGNACFPPEGLRALSTYGVVLTIDVPRVSDGVGAFNRMVLCAQQLARGLGGVLVDAQRVPLAEAMIEKIRAKIAELHKEMKAAEIVPGSPRALKLFS